MLTRAHIAANRAPAKVQESEAIHHGALQNKHHTVINDTISVVDNRSLFDIESFKMKRIPLTARRLVQI